MCPKIYSGYFVYSKAEKKKHDSEEEKEKVQKKTIFENDRLKIIVFYDDTDWQFEICCLTFPLLSLD